MELRAFVKSEIKNIVRDIRIPVLVRCSNCRVLDTPSVTNNHATLEINLHCKNCGKLIKALNESEAKVFNDMRKRGMA